MLKHSRQIGEKTLLNMKRWVTYNPYRTFMVMNNPHIKLLARSISLGKQTSQNLISPAQFFTNTMLRGNKKYILILLKYWFMKYQIIDTKLLSSKNEKD